MVGADLARTDAEIRVTGGERVLVQQDFLGALFASSSAVDGVLSASLGARVVEEPIPALRNREVGLLDAAAHFLIEPLLQELGPVHHLGGVAIFGFQVGQHLGIVTVTQPVVVVDPQLPMNQFYPRSNGSTRRLRFFCRSESDSSW